MKLVTEAREANQQKAAIRQFQQRLGTFAASVAEYHAQIAMPWLETLGPSIVKLVKNVATFVSSQSGHLW